MARLNSRNIYIESNGNLYKFMNCKIEPNDGSFYVTLLRDRENSESGTFNSIENSPLPITHDKPRRKLVRISYHSSGCVLYRNTEISSNYFEPITRIAKLNAFASWSIPAINKLDAAESVQDEDFVIPIQSSSQRIEFNLILAPWYQKIEEDHFAIRYEGLFSLIVIPSHPNIETPEGLEEHFMTLAPNKGLFEEQLIPDDQALIEYHQKIKDTRDLIIYSPNKAGIYTIVTGIPMRVAPEVSIEYLDGQYETELVSLKNNVVKFKVKNKYGHTIKNEVAIKSIELDSEL